jgi:hypothetical protein
LFTILFNHQLYLKRLLHITLRSTTKGRELCIMYRWPWER